MEKVSERPETPEAWRDLLLQRIQESGLSARRFANDVLRRDERTIRRWVALDNPIPQEVQAFLVDPQPAPWPRGGELAEPADGGIGG